MKVKKEKKKITQSVKKRKKKEEDENKKKLKNCGFKRVNPYVLVKLCDSFIPYYN